MYVYIHTCTHTYIYCIIYSFFLLPLFLYVIAEIYQPRKLSKPMYKPTNTHTHPHTHTNKLTDKQPHAHTNN